MLTAVKSSVICVFDCGRVSYLRHGSDKRTGWQYGVASAVLNPWLAKDTVVTPGPDRRGEAKMSHVCLINRTVQGTDDHWKTTNLCIMIRLGVQDWEVWNEGKLDERYI